MTSIEKRSVKMNDITPISAAIPNLIHEIRGYKVMLDSDLACLYGVPVKVLNQAVKRNIERFPVDFMFQLILDEVKNLKSQIVTSSWGGRRKLPFVFTEHGVLMLSSVLNSERAIEVNITIMRVFTNIRQYMLQQASKMDEIKELRRMLLLHIENTDARLRGHDERIEQIILVLNNLIEQPKPKRQIGFHPNNNP